MASNRLLLQIVTEEGKMIRFPGGRDAEADLIALITDAVFNSMHGSDTDFVARATADIVNRGVGFFRTEKHVQKDIQDGLSTTLVPVIKARINKDITTAVAKFKHRTVTG